MRVTCWRDATSALSQTSPARRRIVDGKADLALGRGAACGSVRQEHDVGALIAEEFRGRARDVGGADAQEPRLVAGGDDDEGALQPLGAQGLLDEVADLAPALA